MTSGGVSRSLLESKCQVFLIKVLFRGDSSVLGWKTTCVCETAGILGPYFEEEAEFLGEYMPSLGGNGCWWEKMSCIWEKAGVSGSKGHFDGSKCDPEEHQVVFLG